MKQVNALMPARVLVKYRLKRLMNSLVVGLRRKSSQANQRTATGRKGARGKVTAALLAGFLLFSVGMQVHQVVSKTLNVLGHEQVIEGEKPSFPAWSCVDPANDHGNSDYACVPLAQPDGSRVTDAAARALAWELGILLIGVLLLNLASREWTSAEWDLEWLATMPIPLSRLMDLRIAERTLVNASGLLILWPFLTVLLWSLGHGALSVVLGLLASLLLLVFEASVRTVIDTGLRLFVSASKLRNMQALTSLLSTATFLLVMSVNMDEKPALLRLSAFSASEVWRWTPMGFMVEALAANSLSVVVESGLIVAAQAALVFLVASRLLSFLLRNGIVAGGSREAVGARRKPVLANAAPVRAPGRFRLSPIQVRELKLLWRDRNFMVQTLVLPVLIIGLQFFLNRSRDWHSLYHGTFTQVAAIAFGAASYSLIFSAFQVVNFEGKSLWMLYTLPVRLEEILRQKVYLWLFVAALYPLVIFGVGFALTGWPGARALILFAIVLLGVVIFGAVAACFGICASDPLADDPRQRSRIDFTYLYMILAAFYTYAIFAESYWQKLALVILSSLMALALVQKARDYLPFMLDPTEAPKSSVSLADGLIAALGFFVVQGILTALLLKKDHGLSGRDLMIAFSVAGGVMFIAMRLIYWRKKTVGVPRILGASLGRAVGTGLVGGAIAGAMGLIYVKSVMRFGIFEKAAAEAKPIVNGGHWWLLVLFVVAAPLFEEFIFRGIIFKGLRRTWPMWMATVASAAIFAIVHPAFSVMPVFVLGVVAAWSYSRTQLLITPITVHAVYNLLLIIGQSVG